MVYLDKSTKAQVSPTITTIPYLPNNKVATNYAGLQMISLFDGSNYAICRWRISPYQPTDLFIDIFGGGLPCADRNPHSDFQLKCVESNGIINSTLVELFSLQTTLAVGIVCAKTETSVLQIILSTNINVHGKKFF